MAVLISVGRRHVARFLGAYVYVSWLMLAIGICKGRLWCDSVLMTADGFRFCAFRDFGCVVCVYSAGGGSEVVRCAFRSLIWSVFLRGS